MISNSILLTFVDRLNTCNSIDTENYLVITLIVFPYDKTLTSVELNMNKEL